MIATEKSPLIIEDYSNVGIPLTAYQCARMCIYRYGKYSFTVIRSYWADMLKYIAIRACWNTYYNTRLTQKARFDSKMHGSAQKSPVRHKNARFDTKMRSPACISWHCHYQTSPTPLLWEMFFFQFHSNILFLITHREMKKKLYWYEFKYIRYENWNLMIILLFCLWWT